MVLSGNPANNGTGNVCGLVEHCEATTKYNAQSSPVYTNSGKIAQSSEALNINNLLSISLTKTALNGQNFRNFYKFDTVYCWSGIGQTRGIGSGQLTTSSTTTLGCIILTCSSGTISGTYNTVHSY